MSYVDTVLKNLAIIEAYKQIQESSRPRKTTALGTQHKIGHYSIDLVKHPADVIKVEYVGHIYNKDDKIKEVPIYKGMEQDISEDELKELSRQALKTYLDPSSRV